MGKSSARMVGTVGTAAVAVIIALGAFAAFSAGNEAQQTIPAQGNIIQSGILAGWASGAKLSSSDNSVVEFDEISYARHLTQQSEFEYGGRKMRISHVVQVEYAQDGNATGGAAGRDKTLRRVTARVLR